MTRNIHPQVEAAVKKIEDYITKATGQAPTPGELAGAMTRYFVLKEILEFVQMSRQTPDT